MGIVLPRRRRARRAVEAPTGLALGALVALGAALRLPTLEAQSLWLDEAFTASLMDLPFGAMLERIRLTESTPPLFASLLWAWTQLAGTGELALRLPSALAGVATVPAAWAAGRAVVSHRAGLAAAALVAVQLAVLPWALAGLENRGAEGISARPGPSRLATAARQVAGGEFGSPVDALTALAALLLAGGVALALVRTGGRARRGALLAGALAAGTLAIPLVAALAGFDYLLPRYLVVGLVALLVCAAAGFAAPRAARVGLPALAALVVLHGGLSVASASVDAMQRDDWRAAARALGPVPAGGRVVVLTPPFAEPLEYYGQRVAPAPVPVVLAQLADLGLDGGAAVLLQPRPGVP